MIHTLEQKPNRWKYLAKGQTATGQTEKIKQEHKKGNKSQIWNKPTTRKIKKKKKI